MAEVGEGGDNPGGYQSVPGVFAELSVGAALARSVHPVTVVDEDFHSWFCVWVYSPKLHKISEKNK